MPSLSHSSFLRRAAFALATGALLIGAATASAAPVLPHVIVVGFTGRAPAAARGAVYRLTRATATSTVAADTRVVHLAPGESVSQGLRLARTQPGVAWAVPDYIAHAATFPASAAQTTPLQPVSPVNTSPIFPNDPGFGTTPGGWQQVQWDFAGPYGVGAPQAWRNVANAGHPGGTGVTIAVLDTGVAYADRGRFRRSPDFAASQFVQGYDFVSNTPYAMDHNNHGTHVAGTIAEETGNGVALTGLAFGARIMPVRVLDSQGNGDTLTIAAGVLFAVRHHAQIINMSLEFSNDLTAADIPELISALAYAHRKGVLVVGAAGNEGAPQISYPARAPGVLAVGATTEHGCLADYSNDGPQLDLVAPGGGSDAAIADDPNCNAAGQSGRDVCQETFTGAVSHFAIACYEGTSMAAPHVAAAAALVIASGVLGPHPTPDAIVNRLKATATALGPPGVTGIYGAGLVNAAAATSPGGPGAISTASRRS
jgi:serine protease